MTRTRVLLFIAFAGLSALFFYLDYSGVPLYVFPVSEALEAVRQEPARKTEPGAEEPAGAQMLPSMGAGRAAASTTQKAGAQRTLSGLLGVVFAMAAAYELIVLVIAVVVFHRKGSPSEVRMLAALLRVGVVIGVALAVLHSFGKLSAWSATAAGFAGLLMGWSLQAPVSGVAAWAMVNIKRPFRMGDRVMLPAWGLIGDVERVGMMYTVLNQVGGTVGSEEPAGRRILIPNAMLFGNVVINYTPQQEAAFVLDEVVVRITFDSNWEKAEQVLLQAAREVTDKIIRQTGQEPYIRSDMYDYGVYMRLRFITNATERPRIVHEITKRIFHDFQRHSDIDFAIPFVYSYRIGYQAGARHLEPGREPNIIEMDIDRIRDLTDVASSAPAMEQICALASKITKEGLLQPIVVERRTDGDYNVLAGHMRLHACKHLGWKKIPVFIKRVEEEPD